MQFTLQTLLLVFVLVWSSLAAFGVWGIAVAAFLLVVVAVVRSNLSKGTKIRALLILALVLVVLLPAVQVARDSSRRGHCANNLKQIVLALHNYHDVYGSVPPACVADADGQPMHSWRVLILPLIERRDLFEKYDLSERWDGPNNQRLAQAASPLSCYQCPSDPGTTQSEMTSYLAVVGHGTAWAGNTPRGPDDFPAPDRTILLVEVANSGVHWMEPRDLTIEDAAGLAPQPGSDGLPGLHSRHYGYFYHDVRGVHVAMADGSVRFLPADIAPDLLQALLTVDKDQPIGLNAIEGKRLHWAHIIALTTLAASFLLLLLRPRRPQQSPQQ